MLRWNGSVLKTQSLGVGLLALVCGWASCARQKSGEPSTPSAVKIAAPSLTATDWRDESEFIVTAIATDLTKMAYFAKSGKAADDAFLSVKATEETTNSSNQSPTYRVHVHLPDLPEFETALSINGPIWSPKVYRDFLVTIFKKIDFSAPVSEEPSDAPEVAALTELSAVSLERENLKLSSELQAHFNSPSRHDRAALLVCAFSLRERSGLFYDVRSELNRATAHLAFAEALRPTNPRAPVHDLALAALYTLFNNEAEALEQIAHLSVTGPATEAWIKSLQALTTGDYRLFNGKKELTSMEKWIGLNALAVSTSAEQAGDSLETPDHERTEWARIMNAHEPNVPLGHELLAHAVNAEMRELHTVAQLAERNLSTKDQAISALNEEPEACVTKNADGTPSVKILGWGHWAAFCQRHLCQAIQSDFDFIQRRWGVPEKATQYRTAMDKAFGALRLYPFVRRLNATEQSEFRQAQEDALSLVESRPHLVPPGVFNYLRYRTDFCEFYLPVPTEALSVWFKHPLPPGTAYDPLPRMSEPNLVSRGDTLEQMELLLKRAPFDVDVAFNYHRLRTEQGHPPSAEEIEKIYQPAAGFSWNANETIAKAYEQQPALFEKWMRQGAEINPVGYYYLAAHFRETHQDADAAASYTEAFAKGPDPVRMANEADWLIQYWENQGATAKATALADEAAEVYSARGLEAKIHLLERRHDYEGAYVYEEKEYERYQNASTLVAFLHRYESSTGKTDHHEELDKLSREILPAGLRKVDAAYLANPPRRGVLVCNENAETKKAGLKENDVIVGVRGMQVLTFSAYQVVRDTETTPFHLHVWRNGHYFEVTANPPDNKFDVPMKDYAR